MPTEIIPNEGKQFTGLFAISGRALYATLFRGAKVSDGGIVAVTTMADLASFEVTGTGFMRKPVTLGAIDGDGILSVPGPLWETDTASDWPDDVTSWALVSAASGGTLVYVWDLSSVRDMSLPGAILQIHDLDWFFLNPGE